MSNRSYLYSAEKMPGGGGRVVGLSESECNIPLVYRILVSASPAATESILFDGADVRAITADYEGGVRKLEEFFSRLPESFAEKAGKVLEFLRDGGNAQKFIHLECAEIFEMDDDGGEEDGFFERRNAELLAELSDIDGEIGRALERIRGGDEFDLRELDPGFWSNVLCLMPADEPPEPAPEESRFFVNGEAEGAEFETVRVIADGRRVEMLKAPLNRHQSDCVDGCTFTRRARLAKGDEWNYPIDSVGFYDALWYCNSLSLVCGLSPCYSVGGETDPRKWGEIPYPYWEEKFSPDFTASQESKFRNVSFSRWANGWRLPTREEWLSCAGEVPEGADALGEVAKYAANSDQGSLETARKDANKLGLHDMYGLVWEWVWTEADAHGNRLLLGGSWRDGAERLSKEFWRNPKHSLDTIGFRICRNAGRKIPDYISGLFPAGAFADDREERRRSSDGMKDFSEGNSGGGRGNPVVARPSRAKAASAFDGIKDFVGGKAAGKAALPFGAEVSRRILAEVRRLTLVPAAKVTADYAGSGIPPARENVRRSVCFTGTCPYMTRAALSEVAAARYDVRSGVTKDLDILVCADPNSGSSKLKKAAECGTKVIGYGEFMRTLGPDDDEPLSPTDSKLGGLPYWPRGVEFPTAKDDGSKLVLLAQINFAQVPRLPDFPESGILQFFVKPDDVYGCDFGKVSQDRWRAVWHEDVGEPTGAEELRAMGVRTAAELGDGEFMPISGEFLLTFDEAECAMTQSCGERFDGAVLAAASSLGLSVPDGAGADGILDAGALEEHWNEDVCGQGHKIGGYPTFTQEDPRSADDGYDILLLQIDSEAEDDGVPGSGILWGDMGVANFFITREDLKRRDFSRVLYNWDCM